jgi:Rieske Fe-S protein
MSETNETVDRIRHLKRREVIAGGGLVAVGGILVACGGSDEAQPSSEVAEVAEEIGDIETLEADGETIASTSDVPVEGGVVVDEPPVVVVQPSAGDIKAFSAVCPHQGCLVTSVAQNEIVCPCHGSYFSAEDGAVLRGPARTGLPPVAIRVDGDDVILG